MTLLVFLHGLGQTPQSWQDLVTTLPAGLKAHAPWLRGMRPGREVEFDIRASADEILRLPVQFGTESVSLCGQGLGAAVAVEAALAAPDLVTHLVLTSPVVQLPRWALAAQKAALRLMPTKRLAAAGLSKKKALAIADVLGRVDFRDRLSEVRAHTLVIAGADDKAGRPIAEYVAAEIPDATLEFVAGAGADVPRTAPKAFADLLYGWVTPEG